MALKRGKRAAEVQAARRLLGLPSAATIDEIREIYRELARAAHPDGRPEDERQQREERMVTLNAAYETVMEYCGGYAFPFDEDAVETQCRRQDPAEYWKERFFDL